GRGRRGGSATVMFANRIGSSTSCSIWLPETSPPSSARDLLGHRFQSCNTSLFLRAAAGGEGPQGLRGKREIGRHRGVFEVTVVGREQIELVILRAPMMNPLAVDQDPQLQSPDCQLKPGLEAIDI